MSGMQPVPTTNDTTEVVKRSNSRSLVEDRRNNNESKFCFQRVNSIIKAISVSAAFIETL